MGTPAEDAAYQQALNSYRAWCAGSGVQPEPGYIDELARNYNQGLYASGMGPSTPQPTPGAPSAVAPSQQGNGYQADPYTNDIMTKLFGSNWEEVLGLDVQPGFDFQELAVNAGVDVYKADLENAISEGQLEVNRLNAEANRLSAEAQVAASNNQVEAAQIAADASERNAALAAETSIYIADLQAELDRMRIDLEERAHGAQLSAHPVNVVELEEWKRAGGQTGPYVPSGVDVPEAPTVPAAAKGKVVSPGLIQVGEGKGGWEYVYAPPGTVVAPRAKGESKPTQEGGAHAIRRQLEQVSSMARGGRVGQSGRSSSGAGQVGRPGRPGMPTAMGARMAQVQRRMNAARARRGLDPYQAPQAQSGNVLPHSVVSRPRQTTAGARPYWESYMRGRSMQGGGVTDPGTHTDEEMAEMLQGILGRGPRLYDPRLGGVGIYGSEVPHPGQVSRRRYGSMDPGQRSIIESFIGAGIEMDPEQPGTRTAIYVPDWLKQMQQSWIPTLAGQKPGMQYAY